jgi:hypothetical protein
VIIRGFVNGFAREVQIGRGKRLRLTRPQGRAPRHGEHGLVGFLGFLNYLGGLLAREECGWWTA